jgi:hypothetical protein
MNLVLYAIVALLVVFELVDSIMFVRNLYKLKEAFKHWEE